MLPIHSKGTRGKPSILATGITSSQQGGGVGFCEEDAKGGTEVGLPLLPADKAIKPQQELE